MNLASLKRLQGVGLVGERKAVALLFLGFYTTIFAMIGLSARSELPEWVPVFAAMGLTYGVAFLGVAAEWFWGRWVATGLGYWGLTVAMMAFVSTRELPPPLIFFGDTHGLIALLLLGEKMAAQFDAQPGWRERWHLDEQGVVRVRRSVTRAASSLPALIMFALAPRESAGMAVAGVSLAALAAIGLVGFLATQRVVGLVALGLASAGVALVLVMTASATVASGPALLFPQWVDLRFEGGFAALALAFALLPFVGPALRFVRR